MLFGALGLGSYSTAGGLLAVEAPSTKARKEAKGHGGPWRGGVASFRGLTDLPLLQINVEAHRGPYVEDR